MEQQNSKWQKNRIKERNNSIIVFEDFGTEHSEIDELKKEIEDLNSTMNQLV
jgi:hypothetical protein